MRELIAALRKMLERGEPDDLGSILAVNMTAGLALELSLKLFFMSFQESPPPKTHRLADL